MLLPDRKNNALKVTIFFICIHCGLSLASEFCLFLNVSQIKPCGLAAMSIVCVGIIGEKFYSKLPSSVPCSLVVFLLCGYELSVNYWFGFFLRTF